MKIACPKVIFSVAQVSPFVELHTTTVSSKACDFARVESWDGVISQIFLL